MQPVVVYKLSHTFTQHPLVLSGAHIQDVFSFAHCLRGLLHGLHFNLSIFQLLLVPVSGSYDSLKLQLQVNNGADSCCHLGLQHWYAYFSDHPPPPSEKLLLEQPCLHLQAA